ncbi:MAG: hypothetical protein ABT15_11955 [Pseudonocardia sp. SCN 73-27]|nr:MAG: hypothetical protein ABS80_05470 [Pseudonocardia sp. SCN 72-51]ODV06540.1 MAG: hypothetical protein ABT15_11955 [Pseudonocardia sp. SCN 73-27]
MLQTTTSAPASSAASPATSTRRSADQSIEERSAVAAALDAEEPDLVVTTTRHSGIPDEIAARGVRGVTDVWRRPPTDRPVSTRYLDVLAAEGVVATRPGADVPQLHLGAADRRDGAHVLDAAAGTDGPPVVLVPGVGMDDVTTARVAQALQRGLFGTQDHAVLARASPTGPAVPASGPAADP